MSGEMKKYAVHKFGNRSEIPFDIAEYSKLKYGSATVGKKYGEELAEKFFETYSHILVNEQLVVMESAYSFVHNAASIITGFFTDKLNSLLSEFNGKNVHRMKINRIVPYIADYGKLSMKKRAKLLSQDTFTFDADFARGKFLIFIDDIYITGTHHRKIEEMLKHYEINTENTMSLYYAELTNPSEDPAIESYLNTARIVTLDDLSKLIKKESDYRVVVRTLKMFLGEKDVEMAKQFLTSLSFKMICDFYHLCLGEAYHRNVAYSTNFALLQETYKDLSNHD